MVCEVPGERLKKAGKDSEGLRITCGVMRAAPAFDGNE